MSRLWAAGAAGVADDDGFLAWEVGACACKLWNEAPAPMTLTETNATREARHDMPKQSSGSCQLIRRNTSLSHERGILDA